MPRKHNPYFESVGEYTARLDGLPNAPIPTGQTALAKRAYATLCRMRCSRRYEYLSVLAQRWRVSNAVALKIAEEWARNGDVTFRYGRNGSVIIEP
jgi:hypothetical protein